MLFLSRETRGVVKQMSDIRKYFFNLRINRGDGDIRVGKCRSANSETFSFKAGMPYMVLSYIIEGNGLLTQSDTSWPLHPGVLLLRFPNIDQTQRIDIGPFAEYYIGIPAEFSLVLQRLGVASPEAPVLELGVETEFISGFERLIRELSSQPEHRLPVSLGNLFAFSCDLLCLARSRGSSYSLVLEKASEILIDPAEYRVTIPELARRFGMSPSTFRKAFFSYFRMPPAEYRIRHRIERICNELLKDDMSIKEIAAAYNYPDVYVFSRQFKRYTGFSPAAYRKKF